jgi:type I restriction enzyme R subunit
VAARNHQYLGVNNSLAALQSMGANKGRLGVFWHTQGSGKSISMVFFAQKVLRKVPGHWTFVVVTDRQELDDQIYKNFADAGAVTEKQIQADSGADLKQLLAEDHRYVFTLIQKFRTERGGVYPRISDRDDIIVMTDEAHRSQYDTFAMNMRRALPNASFIGFTGTPLMTGEEKTRQVFGDYVSIYNFQQSIEDGATVPLYYENRIPELQLTNPALNDDMARLLEEADLDEDQEKKLQREFAREYHLITREDRLERVARDIVEHYTGRDASTEAGPGKAMVVCIDKATAVMMYDKVRKHWQAHLKALKERARAEKNPLEAGRLAARAKYMSGTDMAVVVSQAQNEGADLAKKGVDITPHRKRMVAEDLEKKFKDPADPFRIVFVCAMWMTGFDVPSCATIYLDKPMRNHTLMQTIARANRVFRDKVNGLIVDYVGVFRDLQRALAIYAPAGGGVDRPVQDKAELVRMLRQTVDAAKAFCQEKGLDLAGLLAAKAFAKVAAVDDAVKVIILKADAELEGPLDDSVDALLINDDSRRAFLQHVDCVTRLFRAVKPDPVAFEFQQICALLAVLAEKIRSLRKPVEIGKVMDQVDDLLDDSVSAKGYYIRNGKPVDLAQIDFKALQAKIKKGRKRIELERLRAAVDEKLADMLAVNRSRYDFYEQFQRMIAEYNAGSLNAEEMFKRLVKFARELTAEDQRGVREQLSEEELALFDLLTKPEMKLTKKEEKQVKAVAKHLLQTLKDGKLVLDWRKKQQTRATIRLTVEQILDRLPRSYTPDIYHRKCELAYQHVYELYPDGGFLYARATA